MKSIISKLTTAAVALFAVAAVTPETKAANVTLDGYGYYSLGTKVTFYGTAPAQSGRYNNLGADYYHKINYSMDFITNRSSSGSGSLSWEFWAMPYYDSKSGIILMTRSLQPMPGGTSVKEVSKSGLGIYLDRRRFPEQNLWEYTSSGWKFRDYLTFPRKIWL
ncbi:MAG: hypothetical protein ABIS50_24655 [Luteolibacter sp.]|uniref:hypothetical protein n=1 Tax=Luteolibacter sp. TaxID=1962973 RepID=UPI00326567F5